MSHPLILAIALSVLALPAAHASEVRAEYARAFAAENADAKKAFMRKYGSRSAGSDDDVLPLLVQAIADRQSSDLALTALRLRTGLTAPPVNGASKYPGYPASDSQADWSAWLADRAKDLAEKKKLKDMQKDIDKVAKKDAKEDKPAVEEAPKPKAEAPPSPPPADLGKVDRVFFKSGGSLVCYIQSRRVDADNNLVSLRVVHEDGTGEETLAASLVSRIEEDIR